MRNYQMPLMEIDRLIKLSEVERALSKVFYPLPDRKTIYGWIEDGTLEGKKIGRGDNYYIYQSSLDRFILHNQPRQLAA